MSDRLDDAIKEIGRRCKNSGIRMTEVKPKKEIPECHVSESEYKKLRDENKIEHGILYIVE